MSHTQTLIIAEAGVNHNGDLNRAKALIDAAADAGADVVKFQTFKSSKLASRFASKADYQIRETGTAQSQQQMLRALELDHEMHRQLIDHCEKRGIAFLSSPFDHDSLHLLADTFNVDRIKLGSGELTNAPLLLACSRTCKPLILSTGMATLSEVEEALAVLAFGYMTDQLAQPSQQAFREAFEADAGQRMLRDKVTVLHCTTEYPTPFEDVNLKGMDTLRQAFGLPVGYSDHTDGIAISLAAVARGAVVIEKHFTLDKSLPGPDHKASLEPGELASLVDGIRAVEIALGDGIKRAAPSERGNRRVARKSLVASRTISAGEALSTENLDVKRPGGGMSPMLYWDTLGRRVDRDFGEDEQIEL
ncbi:N-acetylneuraminate synthase (plasmid) [Rhizobium sp. WL3]|uniref:N-acetylneuraminate synthase n=1 Tax=Rhizobium sp. WL3 TaxID=2603277 RepID=UPI0011C1E0E6|nr:N-acetylneuraminate synthase [Rhizobium sp. WL3]QEE43658.1 N-acetylneuraminate synthase [Rhizobium sp. WL3]